MGVMVILTLQERKNPKKPKKGEANIAQVDKKKISGSDDSDKHQTKEVVGILFGVVGFLVFCPPQFWRTLGILYLGLVIGTLTV